MKISEETVVEEREELMVSPSAGNPFLKKAYFLKPTLPSSIDEPPFQLPRCFSLPPQFEPSKWRLKVEFRSWPQRDHKDWKAWVDQMASVHHSTWKKAGIYEAIFNSTYQIRRQNDLVLGLAEKWCGETNSFIFAWGEATITMEDVMILAGYSVLGDSVLSPLKCPELEEIKAKLHGVLSEIYRSGGKKISTGLWKKKFMNSGSEFEHEAFLVFWLSRYVYVRSYDSIISSFFPIAIHLARGIRLALAPAVLASIYRDLGLLKKAIVDSKQLKLGNNAVLDLIKSPFQLVQVWAWERFSDLRPEKPNLLNYDEPRMARWDKLDGQKVENFRVVLDAAGENFLWRPYALGVIENWHLPKCYPQKEMWVLVGPDLDDELLSFVRCLEGSELVGFGTTEQYLPHRVAMQFGYDQDLPCSVTKFNHNSDIAWEDYMKIIMNMNLYLPSRLSEADVTTKYMKWWKQSVAGPIYKSEASPKDERKKKRSAEWLLRMVDHTHVPPDFSPKHERMETEDPVDKEDKLTIQELLKYSKKKHESFGVRQGSDIKKISGQVHNLASPVADESCGNTTKSDKDIVRIAGNECSRSSCSVFEKRLLELKSRCKRLESVVDKLNAETFGKN